MLDAIANQDPQKLIKWELEFPDKPGDFVAFLDTEIMIEKNGNLHTRFYRKPTKKQITLHKESHHPLEIKEEVIKNYYRNAENVSSCETRKQESWEICDKLFKNNGYKNPQEVTKKKQKNRKKNKSNESQKVCLSLPYISNRVSNIVKNFIKKKKLNIRVNFKPGKKLRELFCCSRPRDNRTCIKNKCNICSMMTNKDCSLVGPIYQITCKLCSQIYIGETSRSANERLAEHLRYATKPNCKSYYGEALAEHYRTLHKDTVPRLEFEILDREMNTVRRKIKEAYYIMQKVPQINDKEECDMIKRFLV